MDYIFFIFNSEKFQNEQIELYKKETYRVLILYIISVIEAVLLYFLNKKKKDIEYLEYKCVSRIPEGFIHKDFEGEGVVVAVQKISKKIGSQIGIKDLVDFFVKNKDMKQDTANSIFELNDIRNTFHLNKSRKNIEINKNTIEKALKLLVYVIKNISVRV